jgi:hypothetical protein
MLQRLCAKASGLGLCQASERDPDHSYINPSLPTFRKNLDVFLNLSGKFIWEVTKDGTYQ